MLYWKPAHFLSRNYTTGVCCQVWTGSSPACSPERPRDLPPQLHVYENSRRTVSAAQTRRRCPNHITLTNGSRNVKLEKYSRKITLSPGSNLSSCIFFSLTNEWQSGRMETLIHTRRSPAKVSLGFNIITKTQSVYDLSYPLHTEWTSAQAFP